ncbi:MAG: transporter substrate-binding domain-containing protein [Deltaproteobacteria bacterium]|nr:transporter substrate-binding domain-containing protein [Deltaproteobacteria bacterium]
MRQFLCSSGRVVMALVGIVFAMVVVFSPPARAARPVMRIDYPEFWPFFVREADGGMSGFFYEIVTTALDEMEIATVWKAFPWGRCQANVQSGEADAMVTAPTEERLLYTVTHDDPFYRKELKIFTRADHPRRRFIDGIRTIEDIRMAGLSVITYVGNGWNEKNIAARGVTTFTTPHLSNVWRMLDHKRGDIVIEWPGAAWADIRAVGAERTVVETGVTLDSMPFHLLVRKSSPHAGRLAEFNRIILRMHRDGTVRRMVDAYIQTSR